MRLIALLSACALVACGSTAVVAPAPPPPSGCTKNTDCSQSPLAQVCVQAVCTPLCSSDRDCAAPQVCDDGLCAAPACSADAECRGGQVCVAGDCAQPPAGTAVASCEVVPPHQVVREGNTVRFSVLARDGGGGLLPVRDVLWTATGDAVVDAGGLVRGQRPAGGVSQATITAQVGARTCAGALTVYGAVPSGLLRVIAVNSRTHLPIAKAAVVLDLDSTHALRTDSDGVATFATSGRHDVTVAMAGYDLVTFAQVESGDLLVPLRQWQCTGDRVEFHQTLGARSFDSLGAGVVHLGFFGSSVPGSLSELSRDGLVGPSAARTVSLGGLSADTWVPWNVVVGLTDDLFHTGDDVRTYPDPGTRALWGLGLNLDVSLATQFLKVLNPPDGSDSGFEAEIGALLPSLVALWPQVRMGFVPGVHVPDYRIDGGARVVIEQPVPFQLRPRLRATVGLPALPLAMGKVVDTALVVAGMSSGDQGFVPLGLGAGASGDVPLLLIPPPPGIAGSVYTIGAFALRFRGLLNVVNPDLAVSALLHSLPALPMTEAGGTRVNMKGRSFPTLPQGVVASVSHSARSLTVFADADPGAQWSRFDLQAWGGPGCYALRWTVFQAPTHGTARVVTLPDLSPVGLGAFFGIPADDLFGTLVTSRVGDDLATFQDLVSFGDLRLDGLGSALAAFTATTVAVGP